MILYALGIATGAAFAPFWMKVFALAQTLYAKFMAK